MERRAFLGGAAALLAAPRAAEAQQARTSYRIAIAHPSTPVTEMTESAGPYYKAFFSELRRLGYVEGQNLVVERRTAEGRTERFPEFSREVVREAAQRAGLGLVGVPLNDPIQEPEFRRDFAVIGRERAHAVIVSHDPETVTHRRVIATLAIEGRLPTIAGIGEFVKEGGLMSYGVDLSHVYRGAAQYIDRILKGTNPGDLPYQQPTTFELVINLKTAKALGLTIPPSVLARADQVIE